MTAAIPYVVAGTSIMQYQQQGAIGKYNQAVNERNAIVLERQADQIEKKAEFDVAQFRKKFKQLEGTTKVQLAKSGVEIGSGSAYNIELSNAFEAELQTELIKYNAKIAAANKMEEANFARITRNLRRMESRLAQIGTIASAGTSLLMMSNFSMPNSTTGQFGSTANNANFSNYS